MYTLNTWSGHLHILLHQVSLRFQPDGGSDTTVTCTLYLQTVVGAVDLGTCNCFEMDPSDSPDLFK